MTLGRMPLCRTTQHNVSVQNVKMKMFLRRMALSTTNISIEVTSRTILKLCHWPILHRQNTVYVIPGNPYWRGRLSTVDLLVLTSLDKLIKYYILYDNDFRIDYPYSLLSNILYFHLLKQALALSPFRHPVFFRLICLCFTFNWDILSILNPSSSLGCLITFVSNFQSNLI